MVAALTNESATSKSVYFAHCTSEMIFITHLIAEEPEKLAGPLLADTYVTLLKGRNAWESPVQAILQALRDETMNDPRDRIKIAQSHVFYRPSLLGQQL
ncbi:glycerol-3-phosphate dehydrogenase [Trifolium medium]|uniref:Glycerol-3-phosphate dehydrogenase n=1 Tax=Trifolium medium TaxID=97028 RepID=A0A392M5E4_9FABA|nr:glycerol-3-phosphate dehydrogenase [Trifolium medium]